MTRFLPVSVLVLLAAALAPSPAPAQATADAALIQKARAIHDRVIALDTHNDIEPGNFTRQKNYTQRLDTQVNIPKMKEGGLDVKIGAVVHVVGSVSEYFGLPEVTADAVAICATEAALPEPV